MGSQLPSQSPLPGCWALRPGASLHEVKCEEISKNNLREITSRVTDGPSFTVGAFILLSLTVPTPTWASAAACGWTSPGPLSPHWII